LSSYLARDLRKIVARHRTDKSEISPKGFSKSFFVTIAILFLIFVLSVTPSLSVITNILDLISFILATPKLFTPEVKESMLRLYVLTLQAYTFGRAEFPRNAFTYALGALLFLCTFSLFPFALDKLLQAQGLEFQKLLAALNARGLPVAGYLMQPVAEDQEVFTKIWIFLGPVVLVFLVMSASVIVLSSRAKVSKAKQDAFADKALFWAVIIFAYSRALSMMA